MVRPSMPSQYASSGEGHDVNMSNVESDSSINPDIEQEFYTPSDHNRTDSEDSFTEGIVPEDGVPLDKNKLVDYVSSDNDEGHQWWQEREPVTRAPENPATEIQAPETYAPDPAASETLGPIAAVPGPSAAGKERGKDRGSVEVVR